MATGILPITVSQINLKPVGTATTAYLNLNQLLYAYPNSDTDDTLNVLIANDGQLQYDHYTIDAATDLVAFKALVDAIDAENVVGLPLFDVKSIESPGGGNQIFPLSKYPVGKPYMLNQQFILKGNPILTNGVETESEFQYRNNYNDYFSIIRIYASDDSGVDAEGGAGEELLVG